MATKKSKSRKTNSKGKAAKAKAGKPTAKMSEAKKREPANGIGFRAAQADSEALFPQFPARIDVADDDADMLDTLDFHGSPRWKGDQY